MGLPGDSSEKGSSNSDKSLKIKRTTLLKRVRKEDEDICSICHEDFKVDENVRFLECSHMYHESCIATWLRQNNTCPLCRRQLYSNLRRRNHPHMSVRRSVISKAVAKSRLSVLCCCKDKLDLSRIRWHEIISDTDELAEQCIQTNYFGTKRMTEALIPLLQLCDSPKIANVSSSMGKLKAEEHEMEENMSELKEVEEAVLQFERTQGRRLLQF